MITLAQAEMLVTDERVRDWSYVVEGQTLRLIHSLLEEPVQASIARDLLRQILASGCDTPVTPDSGTVTSPLAK